ncbi:hypothetical protein [Namhaeicola litoreus]|uniref:Uncharacterized protein n=1 Tax=Namhaeicola litoreus TaxID=1052145 RepID=A0ABW3XYI7_9FLAO
MKTSSSKLNIFSIFMLILLSINMDVQAQCAMCKAVVESGGGDTAEGINNGIVYLMAFPYLIVAVSIFIFVRNYRKSRAK